MVTMDSIKIYPWDDRHGGWQVGTTDMVCTQKSCSNPQVIWNGNSCKSREMKHQLFWTMHLVKWQIPGQKTTIALGRNE